jgi:transcriptional regulator with XRE-family HTH domain
MQPDLDHGYLRRMRNFLGLTQREVELATGVPSYRISEAESGRRALDEVQQRALVTFLRSQFSALMREGVSAEVQEESRLVPHSLASS